MKPLPRMRLSLLGLAHGDAFGETLFVTDAAARVAERRIATHRPWRWTDDTAMAMALGDVLARHGTVDIEALMTAFVLRFMDDPQRGYGAAAYNLLMRAGHGGDWRVERQALFRGQVSFGNGAAMRVAPLGAYFADDLDRVVVEAARSAAPTHAHPEGAAGAIAIAVAAAMAWRCGQGEATGGLAMLDEVIARTPPGKVRDGLAHARDYGLDADPAEVAERLGAGEQITCQDTVPWCVWLAARFGGAYEDAVWAAVTPAGDRDTCAAIVGGIVILAAGGEAAIPALWRAATEPLTA